MRDGRRGARGGSGDTPAGAVALRLFFPLIAGPFCCGW
ncbi:hypothetical protein STTU_3403 [Streptomyces sp. Tu6071]|nr:hypothetical protein STTU_3403 [Streptomyces sp. Tu6071]